MLGEQGGGGGNMYLSASLSDRTPSSSSSSASSLGGASPQRRKFAGKFFRSQRSVTLKDTTTFKPLDRGVATLPIMRGTEEEEGEKENENVFEENGPRPRSEAIERRNRKISQDTAEKVKIKRKSMLFGRSSTSVSEDSSSSMDISGPEQREFDWRGRQHKAVRTTRRLSKSPQKRKDTMPSLSYASFEVRERERERERSGRRATKLISSWCSSTNANHNCRTSSMITCTHRMHITCTSLVLHVLYIHTHTHSLCVYIGT